MIFGSSAENLLTSLIAAVLLWAGGLNLFAPQFIKDEFKSWGYPALLRISVGVTEWAAALALLLGFRLAGSILAALILVGVIATLLRHGQYMRVEYPLVLLFLVAILAL